MNAEVFVRPASVWWRDAVVEAQQGTGLLGKVRTQRGLKSVAALFLVLKQVIDPCLFVQMEAWCAVLKGYQVSMNTLMGSGLWPNTR